MTWLGNMQYNITDKRQHNKLQVHYTHMHIYIYIYISTWLRPSPPPLIKGWFDHMEANYWSFAPHRPPKIMQMVTKRTPIQERFMTNECWGFLLVPTWRVAGSKKATDTNKYNK